MVKTSVPKWLVCELQKSIVAEQWYFPFLFGQEKKELFN